jgi:3,4-dihydroxy-2-butanone 4-phosphate synthase
MMSIRENEGDIRYCRRKSNPRAHGLSDERGSRLNMCECIRWIARRLQLPLQVQVDSNNSPFQTPFAVSIDAAEVVPCGVTASSRSRTIQKLLNPGALPVDFVSPGHIFPLIANNAGVFGRKGHTEGVYDLARLTQLAPAGILCEVLNPDGSMARAEQLAQFARKHGLAITTIEDIARYEDFTRISVRLVTKNLVSTSQGECMALVYADDAGNKEHVAVVYGSRREYPRILCAPCSYPF